MPRLDQDFETYQNADEFIIIAIVDENGVSLDLTTMDDLCWILSRSGIEVIRYVLADPELEIVNADDTNDGIRITLPAADTGALECGRLYTHQAWATFAGNDRPLCVGYVTVLRGDGC